MHTVRDTSMLLTVGRFNGGVDYCYTNQHHPRPRFCEGSGGVRALPSLNLDMRQESSYLFALYVCFNTPQRACGGVCAQLIFVHQHTTGPLCSTKWQ